MFRAGKCMDGGVTFTEKFNWHEFFRHFDGLRTNIFFNGRALARSQRMVNISAPTETFGAR